MDIIYSLESSVNDKTLFTNLKRKAMIAMILSIIFIFSVSTAYAVPTQCYVTVVDGDNKVSFYTDKSLVKDAVSDIGIKISDDDITVPDKKSDVSNEMIITIKRSKRINVISDGFNVEYHTVADTYREFLNENKIPIYENDILNIDIDEKITDNSSVSITRVKKSVEEITEEIPFTTSQIEDPTVQNGMTTIVTKGKNGIKKIVKESVYTDGVLTETNILNQWVENDPVDEVISIGTKADSFPSSGSLVATVSGHTFNYKQMLTCSATAYDLSFQSTGKYPGQAGYGITASGTYAKRGTVAVDPRVIPLGTKMYIVSTDGNVVYGYCTAEDTGGAIKGNKVDLFYDTNSECMQFGRRSVYVYIL